MKKGLVIFVILIVCSFCGCSTAQPDAPSEEKTEVIAPAVISTEEIQVKEEEPAPVQELQTVPEPEPVIQEPEPEQQPEPVPQKTDENNSMDVADSMGCEGFMSNQTYEQVQAYINKTNNPDVISIVSVPKDYEFEYGECFYQYPIDNDGTQSFMYKCYYTIKDTDQKALVEVVRTGETPAAHFESRMELFERTKKEYLRRFGDEDLYQYKLIAENMWYTHRDRPLWEEGGEINAIVAQLDGCNVYIWDPRITEENAVEFFQQFKFEKAK